MKTFDTLAAVDLGSNSFRLEVARVAGDQLYPLDSLKETVRLAGGLTDDKRLDEDTQDRALACLHRFGERLRGISPEAIRCVGTSALRMAKNAPEFLIKAEIALGHPIEIVAGREEARLIYLGVAHALPTSDATRLVVDIGGGSTEFIVGKHLKPVERESLHMGCVNFSRRFFPDGVVDKARMKAAETAARGEVERIAAEFSAAHWDEAIGSSGTARALGQILEQNGLSERGITVEGLERLRGLLVKAGSTDSIQLAGLRGDRRPVIAGGFAIMSGLFAELKIERMAVAEAAMREGILYDLLGRFHKQDMREATVEEFMRRYHVDTQQAARVRRIAARLASAVGIVDEESLRVLDWAAQLHEIGLSVSHGGYHRHTGYILENADMPGFSRSDQARLALLTRAQRGSLAKVPGLADQLRSDRELTLIWVLRQAVLLCRSRSEPRLGEFTAGCADRACSIAFADGWLERRPLTQRALEEDADDWKGVGVSYRFV